MADLEGTEKQTYTLELDEREFCWVFRLVLLELKSDGPGPEYRHRLHLLAERMKTLGEDLDCVESHWQYYFGGDLTLPAS